MIRRADATDGRDVETIVRLRHEFLADVRRLDVESVAEDLGPATDTFVRATLTAGVLHVWLAEDGIEPLGIVAVLLHAVAPRPHDLHPYQGYIINMYVRPDARHRGLARALIDACVHSAPDLGIGRFVLRTTDEGRPLYHDQGFRPNEGWLELPVPSD